MTCTFVVSFCLYICTIKEQPDSMLIWKPCRNWKIWMFERMYWDLCWLCLTYIYWLWHRSTDWCSAPFKHKVFWPSIRSEWEVIILNNFNWVVKIWGNKPTIYYNNKINQSDINLAKASQSRRPRNDMGHVRASWTRIPSFKS